jgi:predicted ATP-grasp superfamily ATP-dependent carboligase
MTQRRVLAGFAESLAGIESAWSLLGAGWSVSMLTRRGRRSGLRRCRQVQLIEVTPPEQDAQRTLEEIRAAVLSSCAEALMPLDDELVWLAAALAPDLSIPVAGAVGSQAQLALDKRLQLDAAQAAGLPVPRTQRLESAELSLERALEFPLVLKTGAAVVELDGRLVHGRSFACADRAELERAVRGFLPGQPVLAQPLIHGIGEGIFGLATDPGVRSWSAHRRVRMANPEGSGSSACSAIAVDEGLARGAERMMSAAGWRGMFMLEFLRDRAGTPWFMELNGRAWGSMALARRVGLEYPAWSLAVHLGEDPHPPARPPRESVTARHAGREVVHLLTVLRGPRSRALTDWPPRLRTVRDVVRVRRDDRLYNWQPGGGRVWLDDTLHTIAAPFAGHLKARP